MMRRINIIRKGIVAMIIFSAIVGIVMAQIGNEQPVAKAIFSPQGCIACECDAITLDGSGSSDADGQIVSYDWYYYDINNKLKFIASGKRISLGKEFCNNPGTYGIKLVVTDNSKSTDDYEFQFIIKSNPVPMIKKIKIINAKDFYVMGDIIEISIVLESLGWKNDYGKLNYTWDYDPSVFQEIGNGKFKVISGKVLKNNYKINVVVSNACGEKSRREEIELEVRSLKISSSLKTEIILPEKIYEGKSFRPESSYVPELGDKIVYLWNLSKVLKDKEVLIKQSRDERPSFTLDDSEVYKITLEITNRYGEKGSASRDFGVINRINDNPVANASATRRQVLQGEEIILNGSLSRDPDPDGIEFYCWLDKSYGEDLGCSRSSILKVVFNRSGPHEIALTVTDYGLPKKNENDFPKRLSDTDTIVINVLKSKGAVVSPASTLTQTPVLTPTQPKTYQPTQPQPPPPKKESNKIPGMEFGIAIAVIIAAIVFMRRKKIKQ